MEKCKETIKFNKSKIIVLPTGNLKKNYILAKLPMKKIDN